MGSFLVNFHVRTNDQKAIEQLLKKAKVEAAWLTSERNGWISVYEEKTSEQDEARIKELCTSLAVQENETAIAFLVHDSDFVCYWLCEDGKLTDEYNSCPDYFDDDAESDGLSGQPELLIKHCKSGTTIAELNRVLKMETTFAEDQLVQLAELLGIDSSRVTVDFRDIGDEIEPEELEATYFGKKKSKRRKTGGPSILRLHRGDDDDDLSDDQADRIDAVRSAGRQGGMNAKLMQMLGMTANVAGADPAAAQLVAAAANNDVKEVSRLVAAGTDIQSQAPMPRLEDSTSMQARMMSGIGTSIPVTPLMAAVVHKRIETTRRLLELGADPNAVHMLFGTVVHLAAVGCNVEMLKLILDMGGDASKPNAHQQTPRQALQAFRQMAQQMEQVRKLSAVYESTIKLQLEKLMPSLSAAEECDQLLQERERS